MKKLIISLILITQILYADLPSIVNKNFSVPYLRIDKQGNKKSLKQIEHDIKEMNHILEIIRLKKYAALEKALKNGFDPTTYLYLKHNQISLLTYAFQKDVKAAKLLLKYGANPNLPSLNLERGPASTIIGGYIQKNDFKIVNLLLEHHADLNVFTNFEDDEIYCGNGWKKIIIPPTFAAHTKKMINFLISKGAKINQKAGDGHTILDTGYSKQDFKLKAWLMEKYKLPTTYFRCSESGETPRRIIKVIHSTDGFKEYDANGTMVYEYNATK